MASQNGANAGVIVRGIRQTDLAKTPVASCADQPVSARKTHGSWVRAGP
jgi:hypothetical protein